jgi:D-3-phosphoglycerate dehydrogenase
MNAKIEFIVVGLGPITSAVVQPILGREIRFIENPTDSDLRNADAAIVRASYVIDATIIAGMPKLKVIARTGVGTDLVDLAAAEARGIPVLTTPGSNTNAVAEGVMAQMLHLSKRLGPLTKLVSTGNWSDRIDFPVGDLEEECLGIIGYGRIGARVAQLAKAFGMKVIAFDPYGQIPADMKAETLLELVRSSDYLTLHVPLTAETKLMVNSDLIEEFKVGTILVNCSRGALIDLDAALIGLNSGKLAGLGLDVFDPEPAVHHPIFEHHTVVLTPHVMGLSRKATVATYQDAAQRVRDVLNDRKPRSAVNLRHNGSK